MDWKLVPPPAAKKLTTRPRQWYRSVQLSTICIGLQLPVGCYGPACAYIHECV